MYNVTNMVGVLEAITCLENIQITKEALEETRLGKIVNDIRKNTQDNALSLRCKKLVRVWSKQFVRGTPSSAKAAGSSTQDATANRQPTPPTPGTASTLSSGGNRTPSLKTQTSATPTSTVDKKKSENRKRRKLTPSPSTATSTGSAPTSAKKPRPSVSTPTSNATKDQTTPETKNGMPTQLEAGRSTLQSSKSAFSKVKQSEPKAPSRTSSPALKAKSQSSPSLSKLNANTSKGLSKSPLLTKQGSSPAINRGSKLSPAVVATAKAGRSSPSVKAKQPSSSNSTDSNRLDVADATLHVGEEAEDTSQKDFVVSSQQHVKSPSVQKCLQDSNSSSATVKLRSPAAAVEEKCTTPTCSAPVISYNRTQLASPSPDQALQEPDSSKVSFSIFDDDYDDDILSGTKHSKPTVDLEEVPTPTSHELILADTGKPLEPSPVDTSQVDLDLEVDTPDKGTPEASPPQDVALSDIEEEPVPAKPVTAEDLTRIHEQEWDGVNGCFNDRSEWFDWTQCLSVTVQEDNALHILPYICLD
ncbi:mediator of RNA polymerase II transcription subunit 26-like isoform X2 [Patiria miniata]|uniref:TFIIS N-terminal domain-containing protein n=1 Tax=Patiria miniata TaxID=46514 RepID=A0A914AWP2_PATMI|nr:mediator of RNA polymerase II transcription subunit 26-like isoform X2 [Patiria miniata]